jgi:hypothetical protein
VTNLGSDCAQLQVTAPITARVQVHTDLYVPNRAWHDARMATDETRLRLGEMVTARREALGLTKEAAARLAKITSITWKKVEDGEPVMNTKYAVISNVLWSDPGAIKTYLTGGPEPSEPAPVEDYIAEAPDPVVETMLETIRKEHPDWVYQWATKVVAERRSDRSATKRNQDRAG